jgi:hypothetical protein
MGKGEFRRAGDGWPSTRAHSIVSEPQEHNLPCRQRSAFRIFETLTITPADICTRQSKTYPQPILTRTLMMHLSTCYGRYAPPVLVKGLAKLTPARATQSHRANGQFLPPAMRRASSLLHFTFRSLCAFLFSPPAPLCVDSREAVGILPARRESGQSRGRVTT